MTIRRTAADFRVEERVGEAFRAALRDRPGDGARYAVYELRKASLTTPEAIGFLAKSLGVRPGLISFAGLKDKHAETVQWVSAPTEAARGAAPDEVSGPAWRARRVGWSPGEMTAEAIEGNRFTIVVRDLSRDASQEMKRRASLLTIDAGPIQPCGSGVPPAAPQRSLPASGSNDPAPTSPDPSGPSPRPPRTLLILNYFGDQRFGSARHGKGFAAKRLIEGDFEGALKLLIATPARKDSGKMRAFTRTAAARWGAWKDLAEILPRCPERRAIETLAAGGSFAEAFAALPPFTQQMCVEAFQSHLWNAAARRIAEALTAADPKRLLRTRDDFGEMLFPRAAAVDEPWRELDMPIPGRSTAARGPWGDAMLGALRDEGLSFADLRIPGLRRPFFGEAPRPLFVRATAFTLSPGEPDELTPGGKRLKRTVSFHLPRGAYATVVLRALGQ